MKRFIQITSVILYCLLGIAMLSSCLNDDDITDVVKTVRVEIKSEPKLIYPAWGDRSGEPTIPGMTMKVEGEEWEDVAQSTILGFTYETGYTYTLKVRMTILANPPADGSNRRYELIDIISKVTEK